MSQTKTTIPYKRRVSTTQSYLDFLVNSSNDAITGTNLERKITAWNPAAEKLYGYKAQEIMGKSIDIIVPEYKNEEVDTLFKRLAKGTPVYNYETERMRKDGNIISVSITLSPIKNAENKIIGFSTITRDISEHYEMEKKLRLFKEAVEAANDGLQIVSLDGKIIFSNKSVQKIYGFSPDELKGKPVGLLNKDLRVADKVIVPALKKYGSWSGEIEVHRKNGSIFPVWLTASVIKHNNKPIAFVGSIRDITEKRNQEKLKTDFLSMAAHELRTPLTTLKLISDAHIRKYKKFGKDQIKISELDLINVELNRLNLIINDLLDDSRIETGKLHMRFETIDINLLIRRVIRKMKIINKRHRINFRRGISTPVVADPNRIEQVIVNLITNAAKYSPIFSTITIEVEKIKDTVRISVKDEGEGIPLEKQQLIFDRFYQVKENSGKGFGLGLYISREIVKNHKGKMWVESKNKKGSVFYFTLRAA